MASSPRPALPLDARKLSTRTPLTLAADLFSYGYALAIVWATLAFDMQFSLLQGIGLMVIFVLLRGVAHELHKDERQRVLREQRQRAWTRSQSPRLWNVEQRDGYGRRVDVGA